MKSLKAFLIALFVILGTLSVSAQDRFRVGLDYGRKDIKVDLNDPSQGINSFRFNATVKAVGSGERDGFKLRFGYELERSLDKTVIHGYMNPMLPTAIDIQRNVNTHYGLAELTFRKNFLELGARAALGTEKPHEIFEYGFTRKYQFRASLISGHLGVTPLFIEFKKEPQGFAQGFGAGIFATF